MNSRSTVCPPILAWLQIAGTAVHTMAMSQWISAGHSPKSTGMGRVHMTASVKYYSSG